MSEDRDYEAGARAYCAARGWNPDERVPYTASRPLGPKGYYVVSDAALRLRPRWQHVAEILREHDEHAAGMAAASAAMGMADAPDRTGADAHLQLRDDFAEMVEIADALAGQLAERGLVPSGQGSPVERARGLYRKTTGDEREQAGDKR